MRIRTFIVAAAGAALLQVSRTHGETITLPAAADTSLFELTPDYNFGAQDDLPSGRLGAFANFSRSRLLVRFDLAAHLPPNAVIEFASLTLRVTKVPEEGGESSTFGLHRMLRPWSEGTKFSGRPGGAPADEGETTWNSVSHPDVGWSTPGGAPGVDYEEAVSSSERIQLDGEYQFDFGPDQTGQLMQWLQEPESNFGWILISLAEDVNYTARRFSARESPDPEMRPKLVIQYSVPAGPRITGIEVLPDGTARITFLAEAGFSYQLESTAEVGAPWETASEVTTPGTSGPVTLVDSSAPGEIRFYRLLRE